MKQVSFSRADEGGGSIGTVLVYEPANDDGGFCLGRLSHQKRGRRRKFIAGADHGGFQNPAIHIGDAAHVPDGGRATLADGKTRCAQTPGPPPAIGDDHADIMPGQAFQVRRDPAGRCIGIDRQQYHRAGPPDIRGINPGIGHDEPQPVPCNQKAGFRAHDVRRFLQHQLDKARVFFGFGGNLDGAGIGRYRSQIDDPAFGLRYDLLRQNNDIVLLQREIRDMGGQIIARCDARKIRYGQ